MLSGRAGKPGAAARHLGAVKRWPSERIADQHMCPEEESNLYAPEGTGGFKPRLWRPTRASKSSKCALISSFALTRSSETSWILGVARSSLAKR